MLRQLPRRSCTPKTCWCPAPLFNCRFPAGCEFYGATVLPAWSPAQWQGSIHPHRHWARLSAPSQSGAYPWFWGTLGSFPGSVSGAHSSMGEQPNTTLSHKSRARKMATEHPSPQMAWALLKGVYRMACPSLTHREGSAQGGTPQLACLQQGVFQEEPARCDTRLPPGMTKTL